MKERQWLIELIRGGRPARGMGPNVVELEEADWGNLVELAKRERVTPLLYAALKASGQLKAVPPEFRRTLVGAYFGTNVANWMGYEELVRLASSCKAQELPFIVLKGFALAAWLYQDIGLRPTGDLDLLIPKSLLAEMVPQLIAQGYREEPGFADLFQEQFMAEKTLRRGGKRPAQVDLHWHLSSISYYRRSIPMDWFWQRMMEITWQGQAFTVLNPEAQLLHLSAHLSLHHEDVKLVWLYDLALLLRRYGAELDWAQVVEAARGFGLSQALLKTCNLVRDTWGVAAPDAALGELRGVKPGWEARTVFAILSGHHPAAIVALDGLYQPGLGAKLAFWRHWILPDAGYVRAQTEGRSGNRVTYYARRIRHAGYRVLALFFSIAAGQFKAFRQSRPD